MKAYRYAILTGALVLALSGCSGQAAQMQRQDNTASYAQTQNALLKPVKEQPILAAKNSTGYVYRGIIEEFAVGDGGNTVWILNQVEGADYGHPTLKVMLTPSTKYLYDNKAEQVGNGSYIAVTYDKSKTNADGSVTALTVDKLLEPEMIVYNGTVVSVRKDTDSSGQILMEDFGGQGMGYAFNYSEETRFVTPLAQIKAGDKLSVLHSPISTRSIPPQSPAEEVRVYEASTKTDAQAAPVAVQLG